MPENAAHRKEENADPSRRQIVLSISADVGHKAFMGEVAICRNCGGYGNYQVQPLGEPVSQHDCVPCAGKGYETNTDRARQQLDRARYKNAMKLAIEAALRGPNREQKESV